MKTIVMIAAALALSACDKPPVSSTGPDQCLRAQLFQQCLKSVPAGPAAPKYNDWDEVVSECAQAAYYQSLRISATIKPECSV